MLFDSYQIDIERWPLLVPFRIARGAKTEAVVVTVSLARDGIVGRGEGCPYPRYGETPETAAAALEAALHAVRTAATPAAARAILSADCPPGSARNALDCALWDFEAKASGSTVSACAGLPPPSALLTCYTLSLASPKEMADAAVEHGECPLLKLKLGDPPLDAERMRAVRAARPEARLVADATEGWRACDLDGLLAVAAEVGIEVVERPLPATADAALKNLASPVPICADEAAAPGADITRLADRYQAINIKLDKTGGLTGALSAIRHARSAGCRVMIGSMVTTSLSMAPAALIGAEADWVDLDSPLLLARDRPHAMTITAGLLSPPSPELWG